MRPDPPPLPRRALAEFVGTAFLLAAIVGSTVAATRLSPDDAGLRLLEGAVIVGAALTAMIFAVGPVSGAHLNPAVSVMDAVLGGLRWGDAAAYSLAQILGAVAGVIIANLMFDLAPITIATTELAGSPLLISEVVATVGLMVVIFGSTRGGPTRATAFVVGAYITAAYFFTSSTSFANPAVTMARTLSGPFAGIAPGSVAGFVAAQTVGVLLAIALVRTLYPSVTDDPPEVVVPPTSRRSEGSTG